MQRLNADDARMKFDALRPLYTEWHNNIDEGRMFYDLEFGHKVISPEIQASGFMPVIPRTARRSVDEAVDHILYNPKIRVPVRPTESHLITEQEIAEKKRKFLSAWWKQTEQRTNILGDGRKELIADGAVAVRHVLKWEFVPDMPKRRSKSAMDKYRRALANLGAYGFLWDTELLDNKWVYVDPSNHRDPKYAFICYDILTEDAREMFPESGGEWRKNPDYQKIRYLEFWSAPDFSSGKWEPGQHIQWVEDEAVKNVDNPYPYVPIAIEDSGWGRNHKGADVEEKFVGLNVHSLPVYVAQARQWSAMQAVAEMTAFNPVVTRNMGAEKVAKLRVGPGAIWNLEGSEQDPERESIEFMAWPLIPQTVLQMISLTDREVNSSMKSDTLGGIPQSGVDTATEADQNVRNAAAKLNAPVAALSRLVAKISRWVLMDIELVLEAPVTLYGVGADDPADLKLAPREINGYYDVGVELRTSDEEALNLTKARFWGDMHERLPFLSAMTTMEKGEMVDDPLREFMRRLAEDALMSEPMSTTRFMAAAQAFGEEMAALQNAQSDASTQTIQPNDAENLIQQEGINSPVQDRITQDAYLQRDTDLMGAENLGP